jgi:hypothetical protein
LLPVAVFEAHNRKRWQYAEFVRIGKHEDGNFSPIINQGENRMNKSKAQEVCELFMGTCFAAMFALPMLAIGVGLAFGILSRWFHLWG